MGGAYYISLESGIPGCDPASIDGKALNRAADALENAARTLKVRPLMDFFSAGAEELESLLGDDAGPPSDLLPRQYHSAEDGLKTVRALIGHCERDPKLKAALEDLRGFERILAAAATNKVKWHLGIDI